MDNPINTLIDHIGNTERLYNKLRDNVSPNLDRKRKSKASPEVLKQVLVTFLVDVVKDYAEKQGKANEWNKLFPSHVRMAAAQILMEHHKNKFFLFGKRKEFEPQQPEPIVEPEPPVEEEKPAEPPPVVEELPKIDMDKIVKKAIARLDSSNSKRVLENTLATFGMIELQMICKRLKLSQDGSEQELREQIVRDYYG